MLLTFNPTAIRIGIDTREVLAAAGTKWNFLPLVTERRPGLVGGHCIGVDLDDPTRGHHGGLNVRG